MKNLLKAFGTVASLALGTVLVSGCNPDEPAKPSTPPPSTPPAAVKPAPKPSEAKEAPKPAPTKEAEKKG